MHNRQDNIRAIKEFRKRREQRIGSRKDAEEEVWRTTKNGKHYMLNEETGQVTKGNIGVGGVKKAKKVNVSEKSKNTIKKVASKAAESGDKKTVEEAVTNEMNMVKTPSVKGRCNPNGTTYDGIGERYFEYDVGDRKPDLTPVKTKYRKWDKAKKDYVWVEDTTIKFAGDRPPNYKPKKVGVAYKVMEQWPDGTVHPLFAGADTPVEFGEWQWGKGYQVEGLVKEMSLRPRYAWHISTLLPTAPHLMGVGDTMNPQPIYPSKGGPHPKGSKRVWVELEYDASEDYNGLVDNLHSNDDDVLGLMPFGGYYVYKEKNMSEWVLSSGVRFTRVLDEKERQKVLKDNGFDEHEAWQKGKLASTIKGAITNTQKAIDKETDATKLKSLNEKMKKLKEIQKSNPFSDFKEKKYTKQEGVEHLEQVRKSIASRIKDYDDDRKDSESLGMYYDSMMDFANTYACN